ncbi:MAG: asparagine synthetase B, partial [Acidobacteria bacterium]
MCGIAGLFHIDGRRSISPEVLADMVAALNHRGPDQSGIWTEGSVGLGSARLNIIDLVTGRQPIHNEDKTIWVVLNGEIYNYPELRRRLMSA